MYNIHYSEDNININKLQNNSMFLNIYNQRLNILSQLLSKIFNKPVQKDWSSKLKYIEIKSEDDNNNESLHDNSTSSNLVKTTKVN